MIFLHDLERWTPYCKASTFIREYSPAKFPSLKRLGISTVVCARHLSYASNRLERSKRGCGATNTRHALLPSVRRDSRSRTDHRRRIARHSSRI